MYRDLSDGQRWSTALAVGATVLFLAFGLRTEPGSFSLAVPSAGASGTSAEAPESVAASGPGSPFSSEGDQRPMSSPRDPRADGADSATEPDSREEVPVTVPAPTPGPDSQPSVVALVRGDDDVSGGGDASIAAVFLRDLGAPVTVVELDGSRSDMCASVTDAGQVVVAGDGLPRDLRDCIVGAGVLLLSHDQLGSQGLAFSTRLGARDAIVDAALLGAGQGTIGVAATAAVEAEADAAVALLVDRGLAAEKVIIPEGPGNAPAIASGVLGFSRSGVDTVVFAMPVVDQSVWLGLERLVGFSPGHVVADVADAPVNEQYPPGFQGALGVVATKVSWFERDHGETPEQASCRETYERSLGTQVSGPAELVRVLVWCQHVLLLRDALASTENVEQALRRVETPSPLTSPLGVVGDEYGPTQVAVVRWDSDCACWVTETGFRERAAEVGR